MPAGEDVAGPVEEAFSHQLRDRGRAIDPASTERRRIILLQKGHICHVRNLFSPLNPWITLLWVEHSWMLTQSTWMSLLSMRCGFQFAPAQV